MNLAHFVMLTFLLKMYYSSFLFFVFSLSLYIKIMIDYYYGIIQCSKHELHENSKHIALQPLSSVPKVSVVERFVCVCTL